MDIANEHLCYVVTDKKSAWHMPLAKDLSLITKIVITHIAKSQARLAIYTKVEWLKESNLILHSQSTAFNSFNFVAWLTNNGMHRRHRRKST